MRGKRGAELQAIGRSRGGRSTKIHAVCDRQSRVTSFTLTPGQKGDVRVAPSLIQPLPKADYVLADAAYDSDRFRLVLTERPTIPVIKPNPTCRNIPAFNEETYKQRNLIERAFFHLKDWRRVATRYDKLARNFEATVALAAIIVWWS